MQWRIAVVNQEEKLDQILAGFLELGITGAMVMRSEGVGSVRPHDVRIFAGLQTLRAGARPQNQTTLSVIREDAKVPGATALVQEVWGNVDDPATGIIFTIPVPQVVGLVPQLRETEE